ncbi:MAG: hypothetical protein MJ079_04180 [Ruminococcus sp.]|nr:hypothetical protein [Ruminococcus sp.]
MKHIKYIPARGKDTGFILMCAVCAAGVIIGSLPAVSSVGADCPWLHQYLSPTLCGDTVFSIFARTLLSLLLFLAAAFLSGMFALGQPLGTALIFYRGAGIGISVSAVYAAGGLRSLPAVVVLILPFALAELFAAVIAAREVIRSSNELLRFMISGCKRSSERRSFRLYCIRFAVLALISFIISLSVPMVSYLFGSLL